MYKGRTFLQDKRFWILIFIAVSLAIIFPVFQYLGIVDWSGILKSILK